MFLVRLRKFFFILFRPKLLWIFLRYRVLPTIEHRRVLTGSLQTVVDIGANRGQFALACHVFTNAKIFSFEPLRKPCAIYRSVFKSNARHTLYPYGIGDKPGELDIHVSKADDSSSFLKIGENQVRLFPGTEEDSIETVKIAPLIQFFPGGQIVGPALLKLDVQGYELIALKSCGELLSAFDYIYCECSFIELYEGQALCTDVVSYLTDRGFALSGVYNVSYAEYGTAIQADFYFKNAGIRNYS